jgi:hypothetical protein
MDRAVDEEGPPISRQDRAQTSTSSVESRLRRGTGSQETQAFRYDRGVAAADDELKFEMSQSMNESPTPEPEYSWWARARNDVQERIDGVLELLGAIAFAVGGWRQIFLAIALSSIAGGLGLCLEQSDASSGHRWMAIGGFILGLIWPVRKQG